MNLDEYQEKAIGTAVYPTDTLAALAYVTLGLAGEAGEIANKVKKVIRDRNGQVDPSVAMDLHSELGDVLWYVAAVAYELDLSLESIAEDNLDKLASRKARGVLKGSGDNR